MCFNISDYKDMMGIAQKILQRLKQRSTKQLSWNEAFLFKW